MSISGESTHLKLVTVGDPDPPSDETAEPDFIGRKIAGRYTVRAQLGGGGMADVFQATDEQLGLDVAIKLLKPQLASDELRARMVQEARAAAQVRHDHLVRVFGTGLLDSTAYIVMELLDGPNLETYLRTFPQQRVPWRDALALLLPALEALHAVHERGYIHRDIKPSNIIITRMHLRPPQAVVIDLGLVKPDRALRCATSPPTTEVGRLLCTPGYSSPEQAAGLPVDRRSDIYSMAVTLYRVLAGRLPFHDARGQPVAVVLAKHIYNEPTRLARAARGADIPPVVAAAIEGALRKLPGDRPRTMLAFADELRAAAATVPLATKQRRRPYTMPISLGLGAVLVGLVSILWTPSPTFVVDPDIHPSITSAHIPERPRPITPAVREQTAPVTARPKLDVTGLVPAIESTATPATPTRPASTKPANETKPSGTRRMRLTALHRALAQRTADVQRCADDAAASASRLAVVVTLDGAGRSVAHVEGETDSPLSRCIDRALKPALLAAPRGATSLVHAFDLRTPR